LLALSYPHLRKNFVVYARLGEGLGLVPFYVDIRFAATNHQPFPSSPTRICGLPFTSWVPTTDGCQQRLVAQNPGYGCEEGLPGHAADRSAKLLLIPVVAETVGFVA
jgi:hypothetical protein